LAIKKRVWRYCSGPWSQPISSAMQ
jgi:hypothetical protein